VALKFDAIAMGDPAEVAKLWTEIGGHPINIDPGDGRSFRMWSDRVSVYYATRTDELVAVAGDIFGRYERAVEVWPEISRQFPDLVIRVTYSINDWHTDKVRYQNGQREIIEQVAGYFMTCDSSQSPVHHWTVWGDLDPDLLAPYLIPGSQFDHLSGEYPVRDADGVRAAITARLGANSARRWGTTAWTLDEDAYVQAVQTIHHQKSQHRVELKPHVSELLAVVQRDITLTQDEVSILAHDALSSYLELVQLERDLLDRAFNAGDPLHPTPHMIWHLLVRVAREERRVQLGAALKSPRWAGINGRWPKWELLARHWKETRGRPPEPISPSDMEAFTAELRALEARDPVQG
jgi:hypothetical protein